jgi:hypothetical protein
MEKNLILGILCMVSLIHALPPHVSKTKEIVVSQQLQLKTEEPWATSNKLDASHTAPVELDKPMNLMCTLTNINADLVSCTWTFGSKIYTVNTDNGMIEDESGEVPDFLEAVTTNEKSCHIRIVKLIEDHMGDWVCRVEHTDATANQFQEAVLVVTTDDRVTDGIRLSTNIAPSHYNLTLIPVMDDDEFPINGSVVIAAMAVSETTSITLHINDITIDEPSVSVEKSDGSPLTVTGHGYDSARQFYTIHLDKPVSAGNIVISVTYQAVLNNLLSGFYRSEYIEGGEKKIVASTQFQVSK